MSLSFFSRTIIFLALPIWIAVFSFATVHKSTLLIISLILSLLSIQILHKYATKEEWKAPHIWFQRAFYLIILFSFFSLIPIPHSLYTICMGKQSILSEIGLTETQAQWQPLAFRPHEHLIWFAFSLSVLLYGYACGNVFFRVRKFKVMAKHIIYCTLAVCLLAWIQKGTNAQSIYWISQTPAYKREYFFGPFVNPNHAGAFIAAVLPLTLALRGNKKYAFAILLGMGLWSTQSRGALMTGMIGLGVYALYMYKNSARYLTLGIIVSMLFAAFQLDFFQDQDEPFSMDRINDWSSERLDIWSESIHAVLQTPFFGTGYGGFVDIYAQVKENPRFNQTHHAHQEFIELLITYGWLCGLLLIGLWIHVLWKGVQKISQTTEVRQKRWIVAVFSGFVALTASACIDFPIQSGANLLLFICYASFLLPFSKSNSNIGLFRTTVGMVLACVFCSFLSFEIYLDANQTLRTGEQFRTKQKYEHSEKHIRKAIRSAPFASRPLRQYALTIRHRDLEHAIVLAKHSTLLAPSNALTWVTLAELQALKGDYTKALDAWHKALMLDVPNNDNAIPFFRKVLTYPLPLNQTVERLDVKRPNRIRQLSRVLYEQKSYYEAEKLLNSIVQKDMETNLLHAELYLKSQKYRPAWEILSQYPPKNCALARASAKSLLHIGQRKKSIKYYRIAMDHCGATPGLQRQLLIAKLFDGDRQATIEAEILLREKKKNTRIRRLLLHALSLNNEKTSMIPHLNILLEQGEITDIERDDIKRIEYGLPIMAYPLNR